MTPKKRLNPLQSRRKTLKAINVFQSRMLRIEPDHNIDYNVPDESEPEANKWHGGTAAPTGLEAQTLNSTEPMLATTPPVTNNYVEKINDSAPPEHGGDPPDLTDHNFNNNISDESEPEVNKWHENTAVSKVLGALTLNGTVVKEAETPQVTKNYIEEFSDSAKSERDRYPPDFTEQHFEKPISQEKDSVTYNISYDYLNLEAREAHNYDSSDEESSNFNTNIAGVISKDVIVGSSNSFKCDDELQVISDTAGSSLRNDQISPHAETLNYKYTNQILSSLTNVQSFLEEKTDNLFEESDNDSPLKENVPETKRTEIEILDDCNLVLDPATGYFCRSLEEETDMNFTTNTETEITVETEQNYENIVELDAQNLSETERRPKRKRKKVNPFLKSCMDFRDGTENEDFSVGSSEEWSAMESGEDSSGSGKTRKHKKKKKKSNDVKQEEINFKKSKKINVLKIRKNKKDKGESYETKTGKTVEAKSMKPNPCLDGKCKRSCKDITEERRQNLFKFYWDLSVQRRKDWLLRCCQRVSIKRKKTSQDISRRTLTYEYFINNGDDYIQICQSFLLKTLDVTQRQLLYVLANESEEMSKIDQRRSNVPIKYNEEVVAYAKQYIESLPAVPSHYCRPNTKKVYLPQEFKNISNLYQLYLKRGREDKQPQLISEKIFRNIFTGDYNMGFHVPKKDKCVLCTKFENMETNSTEKEANDTEKEAEQIEKEAKKFEEEAKKMEAHIEEKKASYARFKLHQNMSDPETITTSFDLQKVLNTPHGESMLLYYSRKYAMYNLTFYESGTQNVTCYLWGETEGKRGSQEISSCLNLYLKDVDNRGIKNLLLYCDSCFGQNKNKVVLAALNHFLKTSKHLNSIQINYLIPGHTYMPVDSVHAVIENEVKKLIVWSPSQWSAYIEMARKRPRPYNVHLLDHTDFFNYEEVASKAFSTQTAKKLKIRQIKTVTIQKKYPNELTVKYSMKPGAEVHKFQLYEKPVIDTRPKRCKGKGKGKGKGKKHQEQEGSSEIQAEEEVIKLKPLYETRLPLSVAKYNDLQRLCKNGTIPKQFHTEYSNFPYLNGVPDTLAETDEEDEKIEEPEE